MEWPLDFKGLKWIPMPLALHISHETGCVHRTTFIPLIPERYFQMLKTLRTKPSKKSTTQFSGKRNFSSSTISAFRANQGTGKSQPFCSKRIWRYEILGFQCGKNWFCGLLNYDSLDYTAKVHLEFHNNNNNTPFSLHVINTQRYEILYKRQEGGKSLYTIKIRKVDWIGHHLA